MTFHPIFEGANEFAHFLLNKTTISYLKQGGLRLVSFLGPQPLVVFTVLLV